MMTPPTKRTVSNRWLLLLLVFIPLTCSGFVTTPKTATTVINSKDHPLTTTFAGDRLQQRNTFDRRFKRVVVSTRVHGFFGNLFGGAGGDTTKDAILETFDVPVDNSDSDISFESLSDYIKNKWSPLFVTGSIKLTTPVVLESIDHSSNYSADSDDEVDMVSGVRLLFQKIDSGYEGEEKKETDGEESEKKDEPSQGGVEILVEKLKAPGEIRVLARRCAVDDDTVIKEMSEEAILRELQTAIDVWKKESSQL